MMMAAVNVQAMFFMPRSHSPALAQRSVEPLPGLPEAPPPELAVDSFQGRELPRQQPPRSVAVGVGALAGVQGPKLEPGTSFLLDIPLTYTEQ